ncbi:MAG: tripartite tricarboxylate transporter substrate binding protein [Pigmentiphaga sp.]|nr:tripartite tricarboxylate transporter substrate binding protein [Pigmentiphaga sp.]
MRYTTHFAVFLAALTAAAPQAVAQKYPSQPVTLVVPSGAGGGPDILARQIAEKLRTRWNQTVVVENRPGNAQNIGTEAVFSAKPDGHTLLFTPQGSLVVNKSLYRKLSYDPDALVPITVVVKVPMVMVVHPGVPAKNVAELIAYAKANPGKLNYASAGPGSSPHLATELFNTQAGVKLTHIPYKSNPSGINDLLGGQVDVMFLDLSSSLAHIEAGKLRALAVLTEKRNEKLPNVPAMKEILPDYVVAPWWGMAAPPGTPDAIVNEVSAAVAEALKQPDIVQRLDAMGAMEAVGNSPAEAARFMTEERKQWAEVIRAANAMVD